MVLDTRNMLRMALGTGILSLAGCQARAARQLDVNNLSPEQAFNAFIKTIGSLDTSDIYIWFKGVLWGVLPGQEPAPLCGFQGLARHRWAAEPDGSFIQKAYDVGFFSDLNTGLPADSIFNPLTGETVETYHNKYGGFEQRHTLAEFTTGKNGKPSKQSELDWSVANDQVIMTERSVGQVRSKMQPEDWPRESSSPTNFYGGETSYATSLNALADKNINAAPYSMFWTSFSPWEPWLLMDSAPGVCQWRATGLKLSSYKDAPQTMLDFVAKDQPNYFDKNDPWEGYRSSMDAFMKDRSPAKKGP